MLSKLVIAFVGCWNRLTSMPTQRVCGSVAAASPAATLCGPTPEELKARWEEMRANWQDLTHAQRSARQDAYQKQVTGSYVRWTGDIVDVYADGTVWVSTRAGNGIIDVVFRIPVEQAGQYDKGQPVTFEGTIRRVEKDVLFSVLEVHLEDARVLP